MSKEEIMESWIGTYLKQGDITNLFNNIDWESEEPEEVIEYLFSIYEQLQQENKELKERIDKAMKKIENELAYYNHLCTPKVMEVYKILEGDK